MVTTTYTNVRANLTRYLDQVTDNRELVVIQRRGHEDVIMISADELNSLLETAHLLRSPQNAERLLAALERARAHSELPQSVESLKSELGLADEPT
ncbi:MAG: type II toxin-antitoxin system Phd/YefM family antitoxin [Chloroflexi bacterium]|nr:type II toxin-antitoxin system Phd/YefM family antitoxin [Ardenticatenaceae bacterium]MBL1131493.1 type II toxin-antitoxin system Phd/YefM family antitoxin [Chloroflexota bacterium]NOG37604.1 type II toxin-antitoxin system Phd/YefM family antitoxin [Chloroflexota bacterium]